jgi:hypothetical protein
VCQVLKSDFPVLENEFPVLRNDFSVVRNEFAVLENRSSVPENDFCGFRKSFFNSRESLSESGNDFSAPFLRLAGARLCEPQPLALSNRCGSQTRAPLVAFQLFRTISAFSISVFPIKMARAEKMFSIRDALRLDFVFRQFFHHRRDD